MSFSIVDELTSAQLGQLLQAEVPMFKDLSPADVDRLLPFFRSEIFRAGEVVWQEGEAADRLAFILSGKVQIKKETEFKGKQVVVGLLSSGSLVGELSFLENGRNSLTVEALEDCRMAFFPRVEYSRLEESHSDLALILVKTLLVTASRRLKKSYERLAAIF